MAALTGQEDSIWTVHQCLSAWAKSGACTLPSPPPFLSFPFSPQLCLTLLLTEQEELQDVGKWTGGHQYYKARIRVRPTKDWGNWLTKTLVLLFLLTKPVVLVWLSKTIVLVWLTKPIVVLWLTMVRWAGDGLSRMTHHLFCLNKWKRSSERQKRSLESKKSGLLSRIYLSTFFSIF